MPLISSEQFFDALRESGLFAEDELQEARDWTAELTESSDKARKLVKQGFLSAWQASQLIAGKYPPSFGKYKLLDLLGSGPTGKVYLAVHEQMERRVILKTVSRKTHGSESIQQFLTEARTISALDNRNLIHIFDVDKEGETYYLVMEYVHGEDLQEIVSRNGPLPFNAAAGYIALAARGLAHAHGRNIYHHGVKPDRLLIDTKGQLKLLDIGIARLVDPEEATRRATDDSAADQVDYLAPEQATGKNKVDHRADIYSLGCCLFFVLTGHPPYPDGSAQERLRARLRKNPPSVLLDRPDTPPELAEICAAMMATQPRERIDSAEEVCRRLSGWVNEYHALQKPPPAAPPARPSARGSGQAVEVGSSNGGRAEDSDAGVELAGFAIAVDDDFRRVGSGRRQRKHSGSAGETPVAEKGAGQGSAAPQPAPEPKAPRDPIIFVYAGLGCVGLLVLGTLIYLLSKTDEITDKPTDVAAASDRATADTAIANGGDATPDLGAPANADKGPDNANKGAGDGPPVAGPKRPDGGEPGAAPGARRDPDGQPAPPGKLTSPTLAYWRFEDGLPGAYVSDIQRASTKPSVLDESGYDNHLYCVSLAQAPKLSDQVSAESPGSPAASVENTRSLDDTIAAADEDSARYLFTDSARAEPKVDLAAFPLQQWTLEVSFQIKELVGQQMVLAKDGPVAGKAPPLSLNINADTGKIEVTVLDSAGKPVTVTSDDSVALEPGKWYHVAVVGDGKQLAIHVGKDDALGCRPAGSTALGGSLLESTGAWSIGCGLLGGKTMQDARALIDEVRISAVALQPTDFLFPPKEEAVAAVEPPGDGEAEAGSGSPDETPPPETNKIEGAKKTKSSLEGVEQIVELPPIESGTDPSAASLALGAVELGGDDQLTVALQGGDTGHGCRGAFRVEPVEGDSPQWAVRYQPPAADGAQPQAIGNIALDGDELAFHWDAAAAQLKEANFLRNCVLNLTAGEATRSVALRPHVESTALTFGINPNARRGGTLRAAVEWAPDPESIHVEFKVNPQDFTVYKFDPQNSCSGERGEVTLAVGEGGVLKLRLAVAWRQSNVQIAIKPVYRLKGSGKESKKDVPFSYGKVHETFLPMSKRVDVARRALENKIKYEEFKRALNQEEKKAYVEAIRVVGKRPNELIQRQLDEMTALLDFYNRVLTATEGFKEGEGAPIEVRIYRLVDETQVNLLQTTGWSALGDDGGQPGGNEAGGEEAKPKA